MAKLIDKRVQASTLLEVLIAMVIIMVVFTLAIRVFNNVISTGTSFSKIKVQHQLSALAGEAQQHPLVNEETKMIDSVEYSYSLTKSQLPNVGRLEIRATRDGKYLGSIKCLVKNNKDHEN